MIKMIDIIRKDLTYCNFKLISFSLKLNGELITNKENNEEKKVKMV